MGPVDPAHGAFAHALIDNVVVAEGDAEFADRLERASRENHCRRVVDMLNSYLFKEQPTRKTQNAQFQEFIDKNADGRNRPLAQVMRRASALASALTPALTPALTWTLTWTLTWSLRPPQLLESHDPQFQRQVCK